jgi:excisionase family DNA binding protein
MPERLAYPPCEAASLLGVSRARLYQLIDDRDGAPEIPSLKIGRSRRVRHEAIVAYLDRCETPKDAA